MTEVITAEYVSYPTLFCFDLDDPASEEFRILTDWWTCESRLRVRNESEFKFKSTAEYRETAPLNQRKTLDLREKRNGRMRKCSLCWPAAILMSPNPNPMSQISGLAFFFFF